MNKGKPSEDIARVLKEAREHVPPDIARMGDAVAAIKAAWPTTGGLYVQLQQLSEFIDNSKHELAAFNPEDVKQNFIPKATNELDAIVEATAEATHRIMDAADAISAACAKLPPEDGTKVTEAITSIYEACTFQDITGQRVTKIIGTLKVIEARIDKMMAGLAGTKLPATATADAPSAASAASTVSSQTDIDALFPTASELHGPALPGRGQSQAEIDDLFNQTE